MTILVKIVYVYNNHDNFLFRNYVFETTISRFLMCVCNNNAVSYPNGVNTVIELMKYIYIYDNDTQKGSGVAPKKGEYNTNDIKN